jgi:hypothetical protein
VVGVMVDLQFEPFLSFVFFKT